MKKSFDDSDGLFSFIGNNFIPSLINCNKTFLFSGKSTNIPYKISLIVDEMFLNSTDERLIKLRLFNSIVIFPT